jgi:hypothetical protein
MGISTWPATVPREETVSAFVAAFQSLGFIPGADETLEPGFEKVALYAMEGQPKHAARQLASGIWTSKLGALADIEHTLGGIVGDWYGTVIEIFKRPLLDSEAVTQ